MISYVSLYDIIIKMYDILLYKKINTRVKSLIFFIKMNHIRLATPYIYLF